MSRKDSSRLRIAGIVVGTAAALTSGTAAAIPMPDPVARVPLVGLLPRWTWDPAYRPAPASGPGPATAGAADVAAARRFVTTVLAVQDATPVAVTGYRLDDSQLVAVVAELERRDGTSSSVAFTVRVTPSADGGYRTSLFLEDR